jgi:hypothetical protein
MTAGTNIPAIMAGEKAADMIVQERRAVAPAGLATLA